MELGTPLADGLYRNGPSSVRAVALDTAKDRMKQVLLLGNCRILLSYSHEVPGEFRLARRLVLVLRGVDRPRNVKFLTLAQRQVV